MQLTEVKRPEHTELPSKKEDSKSDDDVKQEEGAKGKDQSLIQQMDTISTEGLSPEDARAVRDLAAELLPFSPIIAPNSFQNENIPPTRPLQPTLSVSQRKRKTKAAI